MEFYKTQDDTSLVPVENHGDNVCVVVIDAATTLRVEDSGIPFVMNASAGAQIDLPELTAGVNYRFITGAAFGSSAWTIVSSTNVIQGNVLVDGTPVPAADENTISFVQTAESIGDYVDVVCDGTNWYVSGSAVTAGAITLTVV